jgi:hypothetical protein
MGWTGFGGTMSEAWSVSTAFTPALFVVVRKRMASRSDGRPGTKNENSYPRGVIEKGFYFRSQQGLWTGLWTDTPFYRVCVRPSV